MKPQELRDYLKSQGWLEDWNGNFHRFHRFNIGVDHWEHHYYMKFRKRSVSLVVRTRHPDERNTRTERRALLSALSIRDGKLTGWKRT